MGGSGSLSHRNHGRTVVAGGLRPAVAAILLALGSGAVSAAGLDPEDVKAALLIQVLKHEERVAGAGGVAEAVVLLVHGDETTKPMEELRARLVKGKLNADLVHQDRLAATILPPHAAAVFAAKDVAPVMVSQFCKKHGLLSMTYEAALVRFGLLSVGIAVEDRRSVIVVSARRIRAEGRSLNQEFLGRPAVRVE